MDFHTTERRSVQSGTQRRDQIVEGLGFRVIDNRRILQGQKGGGKRLRHLERHVRTARASAREADV